MLACVYAALLIGWALANKFCGDRWWWLALLNTFAIWLFLPAPVALVLALWKGGLATWAGVVALGALWIALFGWRFVPPRIRGYRRRAQPSGRATQVVTRSSPAGREGPAPVVRVMAFNVLYTNRQFEHLAAAIEASDADLIAMPELRPRSDARLGERLGGIYPYRHVVTLPRARFGTGIYSRWPLHNRGSLRTGLGLRSAVADVETPGGTVRFVALHPQATLADLRSFAAFRHNVVRSFRHRERQVEAACACLDEWRENACPPLILAGDFNTSEFSVAYRCLAQRLVDAYRSAGWGLGHTWPARTTNASPSRDLPIFVPLARIDFVFHSEHWLALQARTLNLPTGSDHLPVLVSLRLTCLEKSYGEV